MGPRPRRVARGLEPMPYWAQVWPASVAMARLLMRGPSLAGQRVIDLGCGLGVAAAAAARRGARVVLFDADRTALRFARFNVEQNDGLDVETVLADWRHVDPPGRCDLVLMADVTYDDAQHAAQLGMLERVLAAGGCALHADPSRSTSSDFLRLAAGRFVVELAARPARGDAEGDLRLVWIRPR